MIETIQLLPGVRLHGIRDTRFRQGVLSLQFLQNTAWETVAQNALLPSVLGRGTRNYPNLRAISLHLDNLYGASVSGLTRRAGNRQATGLYCGFLEDRFALPGEQVLAPLTAFLREYLREPVEEDGGFCREYVKSEQKNLISAIESDFNDKGLYAQTRLLQIMCKGDSFAIPRVGNRETVQAITPEGLWAHYQNLLSTAPVEVVYVGSATPEAVAEQVVPLFSGLARHPAPLGGNTPFQGPEPGEFVTERLDVTQAKLCMGFTTPIAQEHPLEYAMRLLSYLLGGGMTSKLFRNVREKRSLCYSIGASYFSSKGILTVSAGVEPDTEAQTREEILRQLELCAQGEITEEELSAAREALLSGLRCVVDSPTGMEAYYSGRLLGGVRRTREQAMEQVQAVKREQVVEAARTLALHTTYLLRR